MTKEWVIWKSNKSFGVENVNLNVEIIHFVLETIFYTSHTHMICAINTDKFKSCCLKWLYNLYDIN